MNAMLSYLPQIPREDAAKAVWVANNIFTITVEGPMCGPLATLQLVYNVAYPILISLPSIYAKGSQNKFDLRAVADMGTLILGFGALAKLFPSQLPPLSPLFQSGVLMGIVSSLLINNLLLMSKEIHTIYIEFSNIETEKATKRAELQANEEHYQAYLNAKNTIQQYTAKDNIQNLTQDGFPQTLTTNLSNLELTQYQQQGRDLHTKIKNFCERLAQKKATETQFQLSATNRKNASLSPRKKGQTDPYDEEIQGHQKKINEINQFFSEPNPSPTNPYVNEWNTLKNEVDQLVLSANTDLESLQTKITQLQEELNQLTARIVTPVQRNTSHEILLVTTILKIAAFVVPVFAYLFSSTLFSQIAFAAIIFELIIEKLSHKQQFLPTLSRWALNCYGLIEQIPTSD